MKAVLFCIFRIDRDNSANIRAELREAHLQHLRRHDHAILFAGPLRHADNQGEAGSLYVVNFDSLEAATAFVQDDPFTKGGLFISAEVRHFAPGYGPLAPVLQQWRYSPVGDTRH